MYGNVYGQYACRITGPILFHSVPYQQKDKSTLEWWEYDKLGTKASLGCIRLKVEDAKWIYDNCISGTKVEFYSSSTPGPLGKPSARKISGDEAVRNWDPTDPDKNNPWKEYLKNQSGQTTTKPETGNNQEQNTTQSNQNTQNTQNTVGNTQDKNENTNTNNTTQNTVEQDKKPVNNENVSQNKENTEATKPTQNTNGGNNVKDANNNV